MKEVRPDLFAFALAAMGIPMLWSLGRALDGPLPFGLFMAATGLAWIVIVVVHLRQPGAAASLALRRVGVVLTVGQGFGIALLAAIRAWREQQPAWYVLMALGVLATFLAAMQFIPLRAARLQPA